MFELVLLLLLLLLGLIYLLFELFQSVEETGERAVSNKIASLIGKNNEYQSFDGLILKTPDGTTQIDHLIVSPYGIFVIETKNLKGWIFGDANQKKWTQSLPRRYNLYSLFNKYTFQFQNPLHQNYKHIKAVQKFLGVDMKFIFSVVVFTGDSEFKTDVPDNVMELRDFPAYLKSFSQPILSRESVEKFSQRFKNYMENSPIDESAHMRNIQQNRINPICPKCGKQMILRTARKGPAAGSDFWGCPNFPSCKVIKNVV